MAPFGLPGLVFADVDTGDRLAAAGGGVDGKDGPLQLAGALGGLKAHGEPAQKAVDGLAALHAQHRVGGAGHTQVGEEAGALDTILEKSSDYYDEEADSAISSLVSLLEPVMIIFMGIMIGCILAGVFPILYSGMEGMGNM